MHLQRNTVDEDLSLGLCCLPTSDGVMVCGTSPETVKSHLGFKHPPPSSERASANKSFWGNGKKEANFCTDSGGAADDGGRWGKELKS